MAVADGAILRIVASLLFPDSVIAQNVFYTVFADTGSSDDDDDVLSDLSDWIEDIYAELVTMISEDVVLDNIKVYFYDSVHDDWDELGVEFPADAFSHVGESIPNGVAYLSAANTTNPDVIARKYWGGGTEGNSIDNDLSAGSITLLLAACAVWVTPYVGATTGADFAPGVWSPTNTNFFLFNGTYETNAQVAYQRRRKPGVGI